MNLEDLNFISEDDSFSFHCTCCGACCRHREDILLNAYDLWHIANYLKMSIPEVISSYCVMYLGNTSKLPIVKIEPVGKNRDCPFLCRNKCKINPVKPTVCALYPLGRVTNPSTGEIKYIVQSVDCGAKNEKHVVKDWLIQSGFTEEANKCGKIWSKILSKAFEHTNSASAEDYIKLINMMYLDYKLDSPILQQLEERLQII